MTGNNRRLVLQPRDRRLLEELGIMRVIDREQAKIVAGFGSTTRANTRLLALTRTGLLRRCFLGTTAGGTKAVYMLTSKGAQAAGAPFRKLQRSNDEMLIADFFVQHQLHINEIYWRLKYRPISLPGITFRRWIAFHESISADIRLIPDGYLECDTPAGIVAAFLEVDLGTERLAVWKEKIQKYIQLAVSGEAERQFGQSRFRVLVVAHSERRVESIRSVVAEATDKLFWFTSLNAIAQSGFFSPIWLRPQGDSIQPFIKETVLP